MNVRKSLLTSALAFFAAASFAQAQSAHYPAGVEGIKGGTLPPPGLYLRDYNYFYWSKDFPGGPDDFDLFAYVQAPRVVFISDMKVLGGFYGADVLMPLVHQDVKVGSMLNDQKFGVGDVFFEPITLSWHKDTFDLGIGYGFWAPTGDYDPTRLASPGKGYWGHMLTAGATIYLDPKKTWSVSALNRYEINHQNEDLKYTPGDVWTLEYGLAKTFNGTLDVGVSGYYVVQTTKDSGSGPLNPTRDQLIGIGPEVSNFWQKIGLFSSVRYVYEIDASNRPRGHMLNITLTKIF